MAGADRFEDLVTWQRMYELSLEVGKFVDRLPMARDVKFCQQILDASDSAQRNVAEGFGRYNPGEFARFLDISRASATETRALLMRGRSAGYLSADRFAELDRLAVRALQALARFQRYLRSPEAKRNAKRYRYCARPETLEVSRTIQTVQTVRTVRTVRTIRTIRTTNRAPARSDRAA